MGKSSAAQRNRKKGAAGAAASNNKNTQSDDRLHKWKDQDDVCHNGQTPACQILLEAVTDVFPELREQSATSHHRQPATTEPSALAELVRWRMVWLRQQQQQHAASGTIGDGGAKKKKRKKKKKKGAAAAANGEVSAAAATTTTPSSDNAPSQAESETAASRI